MVKGNGRGRGRGFRGGRSGGGTHGGGRGGRGGRGGYRGGSPGSSFMQDELDFTVRMFADAPPSRGSATPRGRGGHGGQISRPNSGTSTPNRGRGRGGYDSPGGRGKRGRDGIGASPRGGRGRGLGSMPMHRQPNATLSGLLYQERPLLRPIMFVPSVLTRVLFEEDDSELLKPGVEDVDDAEQSHVPTADSISRVFSGGNIPGIESESDDNEEEEEIEEVDFSEVGKLFVDSIETKKTKTIRKSKLAETTTIEEDRFTGYYADTPPALGANGPASHAEPDTNMDNLAKLVEETLSATDDPTDIIMAGTTESVEKHIPPAFEAAPSQESLFFIDTTPAPVPPQVALAGQTVLQDDDDDIIVYVAPHPRKTFSNEANKDASTSDPTAGLPDTSHFSPYIRAAPLPQTEASSSSSADPPPPVPEPPSLSYISFSFSKTATSSTPARLSTPPVSTPRQAKVWKHKRERGLAKRKKGKLTSFGAFGAMREEALLRNRDPQRAERRRGDSDLEWGDTDDDDDENGDNAHDVDGVFAANLGANGSAKVDTKGKGKARGDGDALQYAEEEVHGMDIDPDMQMDLGAMQTFVGGLLGSSAEQHLTMDDIADGEAMRIEDEEDANEDRGSSGEEDDDEEDLMKAEEDMIIAQALEFSDEEEEDSDDEDDDEEQTPRTSFQARLERLREKARSKKPEDEPFEYYMDDDDDDSDDGWPGFSGKGWTAADKDEKFIQEIQDMLDENADVLEGRNRKERRKLFRAIHNGSFEQPDVEGFSPAKRNKDKGRDLPPELRAQWEMDRAKKAEYKKARELARLEAAADLLSKKKGGKKGRKAMFAAASLDPTITVLPNRIIDMTTLVQQVRRFITNVGGPKEMALPPTNKETRKNIHEMAIAFNLKSVSKGKGDARYTTLTKTTRSGVGVNEKKVARIVRRGGGMGARGDSFISDKKGRGGAPGVPRHREGDEVGGTAPKLNESNIGFRMLAMMGWAEGVRIGGATGGLDAPLTAIIKNTKLGLGATK